MRPFFLFIFSLLFSSLLNGQQTSVPENDTTELEPYEPITLKGGYRIVFKADDSVQYLYLKKGNKVITELSSTAKGMLYQNLGYAEADFTDYFVFMQSYGGGNPHYIQLIKKSTGKNSLPAGTAWIGAVEEKEFLLYSVMDSPGPKDKMTLLNVKTGKKWLLDFPPGFLVANGGLYQIELDHISGNTLVIKYQVNSNERTKAYTLQ